MIYSPQATDADFGFDGELQYNMTSANNNGFFTIDRSNGNISVAKVLNFTAVPNGVNITITASDQPSTGLPKTDSMQLNIEVKYVDNKAPVFSQTIPSSVSVPENSTVDTLIVAVQANDTDPGQYGDVNYKITAGNERGFFKIGENSGDLRVNQPLDFETKSHAPDGRYALTIEAKDRGIPPMSATKELSVQVTPVNEFRPSIASTISPLTLRENTSVNTPVVKVPGEDQDYGDDGKLTYSITAGNEGNHFRINRTTGKFCLRGMKK